MNFKEIIVALQNSRHNTRTRQNITRCHFEFRARASYVNGLDKELLISCLILSSLLGWKLLPLCTHCFLAVPSHFQRGQVTFGVNMMRVNIRWYRSVGKFQISLL